VVVNHEKSRYRAQKESGTMMPLLGFIFGFTPRVFGSTGTYYSSAMRFRWP
jgi:hypothetical protein